MIVQRFSSRLVGVASRATLLPASSTCSISTSVHNPNPNPNPNPSLKPNTIRSSSSAAYPSVVDRGFWRSLIPKPLRRENRRAAADHDRHSKDEKNKEWNPATYFIVMFVFVGSMAIQMIALRNESARYVRQASARLARLRDVVGRIQSGETDVDVEAVLGTGEARSEAGWEEVLEAIERDEASRGRKSAPTNSIEVEKHEQRPRETAKDTRITSEDADESPKKRASIRDFY